MTKDEVQRSRWTFYEVVKIDFDQTISVERNQLIGILATFLPEIDFDEFIGGGAFESR
ncbi:MAG: hypothetical protein JRF49_09740 [Deltaproteobacteria bacterium]|nr:hypothetical protein [Deltaproteobacteria bacterium]